MCGLIGRNGAGKTTLFRAIMGAIPASGDGQARRGRLLTLPPHLRAAHGIGYMPEDRRLVPEFTVEENIRLPALSLKMNGADRRLAWIFGLMPEVARLRARRRAGTVGRPAEDGGAGARADGGTRMLLLDEPFEGLAPALARRLGEVLANLKSEGISMLIAESNEVHVADLLSRAFRIERGAVSRLSPPEIQGRNAETIRKWQQLQRSFKPSFMGVFRRKRASKRTGWERHRNRPACRAITGQQQGAKTIIDVRTSIVVFTAAIGPSSMQYREFEQALVAVFSVNEAYLSIFRARLRHLRALGVPNVPKRGSGNASTYTPAHLFTTSIALTIGTLGYAPTTAVIC